MTITPTPLHGAFIIDLAPRHDDRGHFVRTYCEETFGRHGLCTHYVQANQSLTKIAGAVRGMHYQAPPVAEVKLVRCIRGRVWDVFVDLRHGSPTFLHHFAVELSESNVRQAYIPPGFAHGFQTLEPHCEVAYQVSAPYTPSAERAVRYSDPRIGIRWPLDVVQVSAKDAAVPLLDDAFTGVVL
jgi:dTDP-4-dehydrorhamnose 3,5-epimerase